MNPEETKHPSSPTLPEAAASGSVTPETDAVSRQHHPKDAVVILSRKLERERNAALTDLEFRRGLYDVLDQSNRSLRITLSGCNAALKALKRENDQLKKLKGWRPIETAPKCGIEFVAYCPPAHGLPHMVIICVWHDDAGFCVDELREPTLWMPLQNAEGMPPTRKEHE